ncbi:MAG: undecaprenyl-diphosphate phosphatase, partial [Ruminococcus sp.]|nr:undecaprenyl-diphosphate phosphatase [Ruminococcus sp.]
KWREMNGNRRMIIMIIISILPLFVFYIFKDFFTSLASDDDIIAEGISFLYTSVLLFLAVYYSRNNTKTSGEVTVRDALFIGTMQGVALLPGVSRSGSTIAAGMLCGMKREDAVEYGFILGIPVIIAGAASEMLDARAESVSVEILPLIIGGLIAAVVGYLSIKLIKLLVVSDKFRIFAYYTGILGLIVITIGLVEKFA